MAENHGGVGGRTTQNQYGMPTATGMYETKLNSLGIRPGGYVQETQRPIFTTQQPSLQPAFHGTPRTVYSTQQPSIHSTMPNLRASMPNLPTSMDQSLLSSSSRWLENGLEGIAVTDEMMNHLKAHDRTRAMISGYGSVSLQAALHASNITRKSVSGDDKVYMYDKEGEHMRNASLVLVNMRKTFESQENHRNEMIAALKRINNELVVCDSKYIAFQDEVVQREEQIKKQSQELLEVVDDAVKESNRNFAEGRAKMVKTLAEFDMTCNKMLQGLETVRGISDELLSNHYVEAVKPEAQGVVRLPSPSRAPLGSTTEADTLTRFNELVARGDIARSKYQLGIAASIPRSDPSLNGASIGVPLRREVDRTPRAIKRSVGESISQTNTQYKIGSNFTGPVMTAVISPSGKHYTSPMGTIRPIGTIQSTVA